MIGTAFIILAGPKAWINQAILSNRLMMWIGLISYPLYLWHWPLLSFAFIVESETPSMFTRLFAVLISFPLSFITYKVIEAPFRSGNYGNIKVFSLLTAMVIFGFVGYHTYQHDGLRNRKSLSITVYAGDIGHYEYHRSAKKHSYVCLPEEIAKEAPRRDQFVRCMQSKPDPKIDIALIGDSHAEHLFPGLAEALPLKNIVYYIKGGPPFLDNPEFSKIFATIRNSKTIKTVILTMYWNYRYSAVPVGSTLEKELIDVFDLLLTSGKNVYLTSDIPEFPFSPEKCKYRRWLAQKNSCEIMFQEYLRQTSLYIDSLKAVINKRPAATIFEIGKYLCNEFSCGMTQGNEILYRDNNHLNINGSRYIAHKLVGENPNVFK